MGNLHSINEWTSKHTLPTKSKFRHRKHANIYFDHASGSVLGLFPLSTELRACNAQPKGERSHCPLQNDPPHGSTSTTYTSKSSNSLPWRDSSCSPDDHVYLGEIFHTFIWPPISGPLHFQGVHFQATDGHSTHS